MACCDKRQQKPIGIERHEVAIVFRQIARGVTARPWFVIAAWILVAAGIVAFAPSLGSVTNSDQSAFLPNSTESARATALARSAFANEQGATAVVVVRRGDRAALTEADLATLAGLMQRLN